MIRSLIIAFLISLVVWILTFDLFFTYGRLQLSLVVAIAAAIIAFLILRLSTKPGESISLGYQIIVPLIIAGGALFATSIVTAVSCGNTALPVIQCGPARIAPNEICVYKNGTIDWDTNPVPLGVTVRIYDFKKKGLFSETPDQPLDKREYTGVKGPPIHAQVKGNKEGYFKYTISCGGSDWNDPGIDVPK
jgi:hypothetical protein